MKKHSIKVAIFLAVAVSLTLFRLNTPMADARPLGLDSITKVVGGSYHTCLLTSGGGVKCWGYNSYGQLGDGTTTSHNTSVDVVGLSGGIATLVAGAEHTCVLTTGGGVKCWGRNDSGQLGDGTTTSRLTPVNVVGLSNGVTALISGYAHTCAVQNNNEVVCWGSNSNGQLGDTSGLNQSRPVKVLSFKTIYGITDTLKGIANLTAGERHTCALTLESNVKCWGGNSYGQIGDGTQTQRITPTVTSLLTNVVSLASGSDHNCAIISGGNVKCWGRNDGGYIGDGTNDNNRLTPVDVLSGVAAVALKYRHSCALLTNGGLKCWGNNDYGQVGDGTIFSTKSPVDVFGLSGGVTNVIAGRYHACALTSNGSFRCWGNNTYGQLGDNTNTQHTIPTDIFISQISTDTLNLSVTKLGGHISTQSFTINNLTTGVMTWTATTASAWLFLNSTVGTAPSTVVASPNVTGLTVGTYTGQIFINSKGGAKTINVTLKVTESDLQISPTKLNFSGIEKDVNPLTQTLTITSNIATSLAWSATKDAAWLTLSSSTGTTPNKIEVSVDTTGLGAGTYSAKITLLSGSEQQIIPVTLTISKPILQLDPPALTFALIEGSSYVYNIPLKISNNGTRQLSWRLTIMGNGLNWLNLSNWAGTTPTTIQASASAGDLKVGTYQNSITFYCNEVQNSRQTMTATLVVYKAGMEVVQTVDKPNPSIGETVNYNYRLTNLGSVAFDKVSMSDNAVGLINTDSTALLPNSIKQYKSSKVINENDVLSSSPTYQITNIAVATGTISGAELTTNSNPVTITLNLKPSLAVQKSTNSAAVSKPGEVVVYHYFITNTGNITLYNLQLTDNQAGSSAIGMLAPGQSNNSLLLGYTASADDLKADIITSTVTVSGTLIDYDIHPRTISANSIYRLAIASNPVLNVAPTSLNFEAIEEDAPITQTLTMTNSGTGLLNWTASAASVGDWLMLDQTKGTAPTSLNVIANLTTLSAGTHSGQIILMGNGGTKSINVALKILPKGGPTATPTNTPTPSPTGATTTPTPTVPTTPTATPVTTPDPNTGYEPNNTCAQAMTMPTDGTVQHHRFQVMGDKDWVYFQATAGTSYLIEAQVPPNSLADVALELYNDCNGLSIDRQDYDFSPNVRLPFTAPKDGVYYLRLSNHDIDVGGANVAYDLSIRNLSQSGLPGALVLVAGKLQRLDPTQKNIHNVTNNVYRLFRSHGYDAERIYYLATDLNLDADGGGADVDAMSAKDDLQKAITIWAPSRVGTDRAFTLYLVDHGGVDRFYLNGQTETVTPAELNQWLETLEAAVPGVKINIILESCHAGSFIDLSQSLSKAGRVIIASTGAYAVAYSSEQGAIFSDLFLETLGRGSSLYTAFEEAKALVEISHLDQTPWLDDNGNGAANNLQDGALAQQRGFNYAGTLPGETWPPYVVSADLASQVNGQKGTIQAEVRDDSGIATVWAVIYKPSYAPPDPATTEAMVQENLPTVTLLDTNNDGVYTATYEGFDEEGQYRILVYATDKDGALAQPREVLVQLGNKINLLQSISLTGTLTGIAGTVYEFTAQAAPITATLPITYIWRVADQAPITHTVSALQDTAIFTFQRSGTQTVTVTASNDGGWVTSQHLITISQGADITTTLIYTTAEGYRAEVVIPAGAVDEPTEFVYTPVLTLSHDVPSDLLFANRAFKLEAMRQGKVLTGLIFSRPVTITLNYLITDVIGLAENSLELRYWDGRAWAKDGLAVVTLTNQRLVVTSNHLSEFALFGKKSSLGTVYLPIVVKK